MSGMCSFYFGLGKGNIEGLGVALEGGYDQPVLDAASTQDYLHKVLRSIDLTAEHTDHETDYAFTWHDSRLFAKIDGQWLPVAKEDRAKLIKGKINV